MKFRPEGSCRHQLDWSFDCEESLERHIFHNRHDVDEPGPPHQVEVAFSGEGLKDPFEAASLVDNLGLTKSVLELEIGVDAGAEILEARIRRADLFEEEEGAAPVLALINFGHEILTNSRWHELDRVTGDDKVAGFIVEQEDVSCLKFHVCAVTC